MQKKWICLLLAVLCLFSATAMAENENLLVNGDFEILDGKGLPSGWYTDAWYTQIGYTDYSVTDEGRTGSAAVIENNSANDARFAQTVQVEPNASYCLSGYIMAAGISDENGLGANLSINGVYVFSPMVYATGGEWQYVEVYGVTGPSQTSVTVFARLGGYSGENSGWAAFDDLALTKVDDIPQSAIAYQWYTQSASNESGETEIENGESTRLSWPWLSFTAVVYLALALLLCEFGKKHAQKKAYLFAGLLVGTILRFVLMAAIPGYAVDIGCFTSWGNTMYQVGPASFYQTTNFCDYPPAYMLLLWVEGLLLKLFPDASLQLTIVKLIPVLFDLGTSVLLYKVTKKLIDEKAALLTSGLYLFSPAILVTGAAWGQCDSVMTFFLLLCVIFAVKQKWQVALPLYVLSVLIKPQALMFGPIGLLALVLAFVWNKQDRKVLAKNTLIGIVLSLLTAAAIILPFSPNQENVFWIWDKYKETLSSYDYAVLNVANLFYILGGNWVESTASLQMQFPFVTGVCALIGAAALYLARKNEEGDGIRKYGLPLILLAMGLAFIIVAWRCTYALYGTLMMVFAFVYGCYLYYESHDSRSLPFVGALVLILIYVFGVKMHERYIYPALLLLLFAYAYRPDKRLMALFTGFTMTTFINVGIVLFNSIQYGSSMGHLNNDTLVCNDTLAVINILMACYTCYVAYDMLLGFKKNTVILENKPKYAYHDLIASQDHRLHVKKKEVLTVAVITVLYAALSFFNLGSTTAPQTTWVSGNTGETVTIELQQESTFEMLYYCPVTYNGFTVRVSSDGASWSQEYNCDMDQGQCYHWKYLVESYSTGDLVSYTSTPLQLTGKYILITVPNVGTSISEVIFRDPISKQVLPVASVTGGNRNESADVTKKYPVENICDEQNTMTGEPSWYNSMYFDEIYHGRTAYEHATGTVPYETTHPPLGKVFMSWAVMLFGMTPFGWRFAGNLAGVLMLPAMYFLARQLTHRKDLSLAAMLLMTFDTFHFTQCRLATIDSFPVLFIILSYAFMIRYITSDPFEGKVYRHWGSLALSGLCMGMGIASKWIGIYSAVGLAVLFFYSCVRALRTGALARKMNIGNVPEESRERVKTAQEKSFLYVLLTCCACLVFFIAVPVLIYYLSYIPYFAPSGGVSIDRIIQAQEVMLSYHSTPGLGADHPYQSPWWEWPLVIKPMWYYSSTYSPEGMDSTIFVIGNPAVWWTGLIAVVVMLGVFLRRHYYAIGQGKPMLQTQPFCRDWLPVCVGIGFLSQFLPWVLVPRSTYIYHYFASVPFLIMATVWWLGRVGDKHPKLKILLWLLVGLAALLFIGFYPYASGVMVSTDWLTFMQWFPRIYF